MAKIPIRIVSDGANVSGGLGTRTLGPSTGWVLVSDYGAANVSGGVIPMTQAEYAANTGSSGFLLMEDGFFILLEDASKIKLELN